MARWARAGLVLGSLLMAGMGAAQDKGASDAVKPEVLSAGGLEGQADVKGAAGCLGIGVKAIPKKGSLTQGFSARQILDLSFRVRLAAGQAPENIELRYFTPGNHLYQSVLVPVAAAASPELQRALPGYPFPVKVARQALDTDRGAAAGATAVETPAFPVAGTMIVNNALYGDWRVEAWPQGAAAPCSLSFKLKP